MKKILLVLIFLTIVKLSFSQDCFTVMKVKGEITRESTGKIIKADDQLCSNEKITFKSKDAAAILYSAAEGKFTIKPDKQSRKEISGIISANVANVLSKVQKQTNTRIEFFSDTMNFSNFEIKACELNIIGQFQMFVICDNYTAETPITAKYNYNGVQQTVNLINTGEGYLLEKKSVYTINGLLVDENDVDEVTIYCNDEEMAKYILRFPDVETLRTEFSDYISSLRSKDKIDFEIYEEIEDYFFSIYGIYEPGNLEQFLLENFNLKKELL